MKKAVVMARVSSDEQALGYSLKVQEDAIGDYCLRNDIQVVHTIREDHSAKDFNRPEFQEFLTLAKASKGKIDLLLFTTWDRFSRNIQDAYQMISILDKLGIRPMAIQQPIDLSIPENKMMLAVYLVIPEIDNDRRSIKIREGIRKALESGRWVHAAPRGYSFSSSHHNRSIIEPNKKAQYIRYAFEQFDKGIAQAEIITALNDKGYRIPRTRLSELLRNPVYMGKVPLPAYEDKPASLVKGLHKGIISEVMFYRVQGRLKDNLKKMKRPKKNRLQPELPFRGILLCSVCHKPLTGSASRSATGQRYYYYHCNYCHQERFRATKVDQILGSMFDSFEFHKEVDELYREMVRVILSGGPSERKKQRQEILTEIKKLDKRMENLQDMLSDGEIPVKDYQEIKAKYEYQKQTKLGKFDELVEYDASYERDVLSCTHITSRLGQSWRSEDPQKKIALLSSIFPEKLEIVGEKCRTTRINDFVRLIVQEDKDLQKKESGQLSPFLKLSRPVETTGI